jgi:protein-tyrosine phosphatase
MAAILFVCTANICRSPMAEAVFKAKLAQLGGAAAQVFKTVASAGVHADPRGGPIDARALACLNRHDYSVERRWRSRRVDPATDFDRYDLILAMEQDHLDAMRRKASPEQAAKMRLLLDFAPGLEGRELPDPYFGPANGFDLVLGMIELGVKGLTEAWREGRLKLA